MENITFSYQREKKNSNNETAKDVFRTEHNKLAEKGEKWMKDTANSCMLVSTLIATVLFAAAFTVEATLMICYFKCAWSIFFFDFPVNVLGNPNCTI